MESFITTAKQSLPLGFNGNMLYSTTLKDGAKILSDILTGIKPHRIVLISTSKQIHKGNELPNHEEILI